MTISIVFCRDVPPDYDELQLSLHKRLPGSMSELPSVPYNYVCVLCGLIGNHWIMDCAIHSVSMERYGNTMEDIMKRKERIKQQEKYEFYKRFQMKTPDIFNVKYDIDKVKIIYNYISFVYLYTIN